MATSTIKALIPCDIHKVWEIVTMVDNYTWRSDLRNTEVVDENQFIEYTKEGYPTTFTITAVEPYKMCIRDSIGKAEIGDLCCLG